MLSSCCVPAAFYPTQCSPRILEEGLQPLFQAPERLFVDIIDQAGPLRQATESSPIGINKLAEHLSHMVVSATRWWMPGIGSPRLE